MKVIITGATGRIGGAVLQSALSNPAITNVVVLSRRDIDIQHAKLQTIIKKDYTHYKPEELAQLEGAEGCIWYAHSVTFLRSTKHSLTLKTGPSAHQQATSTSTSNTPSPPNAPSPPLSYPKLPAANPSAS